MGSLAENVCSAKLGLIPSSLPVCVTTVWLSRVAGSLAW